MERGNAAYVGFKTLYEAKNNNKLHSYGVGTPMDFAGADCAPSNDLEDYMDVKNNPFSIIYQYNRDKKWSSGPNPYKKGCISKKIVQYDEYRNDYVVLTMEEYWNKYFNDASKVIEIRNKVNKLSGRCELNEYILRAKQIEEFIKPYLNDNVICERSYETEQLDNNGKIKDCKIILKVK